MENKENKYQMILLGSVIICAIFTFVTIAWAAFSTTLKISGTATIKAQTWNVYWSAASVDNSTGATTATSASIDTIGSSTNTISLTALSADSFGLTFVLKYEISSWAPGPSNPVSIPLSFATTTE